MNSSEPKEELLSMDQAIEQLKTTRPTFYRWLRSGKIKGMKVGRQWRFYPADIERFLKGEQPRIELQTDITPLIQELSKQLTEHQVKKSFENHPEAEQAAQMILQLALAQGASDIHLEPIYLKQGKQQAVLRHRLDGRLHTVVAFDRRLLAPILEQFKILSACAPFTNNQVQEGQFTSEWPEKKQYFEVRTHFLPAGLGESLTMHLLNKTQAENMTLERLRMKKEAQTSLESALKQGWGLIIASGPTGSGKTTTMYAALTQVASPEIKSISLEDPVEMYFPWVTSVPVQTNAGQSFSTTLRSVMQADPDVLVLGELRDAETVTAAMRTALTGHLVLTQLHTKSAVHALLRLIEVSGNPYTVTESVRLILNQRLIRRLCPDCSEKRPLQADQQDNLNYVLKAARLNKKSLAHWQKTLEKGLATAQGCKKCQGQGYRGRIQITEALEMSPQISRLLHAGTDAESIQNMLQEQGWQNFVVDGLERIQAEESSLEELVRILGIS